MNTWKRRLIHVACFALPITAVACGPATADDEFGTLPGNDETLYRTNDLTNDATPDSSPPADDPPFRDIVGDPFRFDFDQALDNETEAADQPVELHDNAQPFWKNYQVQELPTQEGDVIYQNLGLFAAPPLASVPPASSSRWLLTSGALLCAMMLVLSLRAVGRCMSMRCR